MSGGDKVGSILAGMACMPQKAKKTCFGRMAIARWLAASILCLTLSVVLLPVGGSGWTEEDLWDNEIKLEELRDAIQDQVSSILRRLRTDSLT